jgi:hypothetical protein
MKKRSRHEADVFEEAMRCQTCGLNQRYDPEAPMPSDYNAEIECEGCHVRNGNICALLEGILKLAQCHGLVREDLTLAEFTGPHALQSLEDMLKEPQRIKYELPSD